MQSITGNPLNSAMRPPSATNALYSVRIPALLFAGAHCIDRFSVSNGYEAACDIRDAHSAAVIAYAA